MFTIAVYNPISGSGSTTITANLFALMMKRLPGQDLCLIDGDLFFPGQRYFFPSGSSSAVPVHVQIPHIDRGKCILCNACARACHFNAIRIQRNVGFIQFDENNCISCGACFNTCRYGAISLSGHKPGQILKVRLSAHASLVQASPMVPERYAIPMIWQMKQQAIDSDICLIDVRAGLSAESMEALFEADLLLIVMDALSFSESYCHSVLPDLRRHARQTAFIINRANGNQLRFHDFALRQKMPVLVEFPYDEKMHWYGMEGVKAVDHVHDWNQLFAGLLNHVLLFKRRL